jgi:nucleoside-diphosphate-sugar epimerase
VIDLHNRTVLVTGAAGFVGSWLVERLTTAAGARVRALIQPGQCPAWLTGRRVEVVAGDVRDRAQLGEVAAGCDVVFHLAAWIDDPPDAGVAWATNVDGTQNLLDVARGAERFVYVSSIMVYRPVQRGVVGEDHAFARWHPRLEPYGATKIAAERRAFEAYQRTALPVTVVRPSNVYGPRAGTWVARGLRRMQAGQPILIGDGRGLANPVFVENLVDGIILAARHPAAVGEAYNLSDGVALTWREFYARYAELIGVAPRSTPVSANYLLALARMLRGRLTGQVPSLTPNLIRHIVGEAEYSIDKARRDIGYEPRVDFDVGMRRVQDWYDAGGDLLGERP